MQETLDKCPGFICLPLQGSAFLSSLCSILLSYPSFPKSAHFTTSSDTRLVNAFEAFWSSLSASFQLSVHRPTHAPSRRDRSSPTLTRSKPKDPFSHSLCILTLDRRPPTATFPLFSRRAMYTPVSVAFICIALTPLGMLKPISVPFSRTVYNSLFSAHPSVRFPATWLMP